MAIPHALPAPSTTSADLASLMGAVDPRQSATVKRVAMQPRPEFWLRHHPACWDAESEGLDQMTWLPDVAPLMMVPGAHLVRTRKRGEDADQTYQHTMNVDGNKGWVHLDPNVQIPAECLPPGVPPGGYLRALPCKDPRSQTEGLHHVEAWNVPRQPVPGRPQRFTFDRGAYNRWRLWLVTSGQVAPPSPDVIAEMQAAKAGRPARIASLPIPDDLRRVRMDAISAELAGMADAAVPESEMETVVRPKAKAKAAPKGGAS